LLLHYHEEEFSVLKQGMKKRKRKLLFVFEQSEVCLEREEFVGLTNPALLLLPHLRLLVALLFLFLFLLLFECLEEWRGDDWQLLVAQKSFCCLKSS
jgi:hypothetical protein